MTTPTVALSIAGSDSSGGAGLQADLRTFAAHGVHGAAAVTAVTAQNTVGVQGVHVVPADLVAQQVASVLGDLDVAAVKTGMLATAEVVERVARLASDGRLPNLVVDPVMVSSTGARLLDEGAETVYRQALIPEARVVTPNRSEAEVLCGRTLLTVEAVGQAALELAASGPEVVVVTGGDPDDRGTDPADVVAVGGRLLHHRDTRIDTVNDHGTGCSFASSLAAHLARGADPLTAVRRARTFVRRGLAGAADWHLGAGHGPIDHLGWAASTSTSSSSSSPSPSPFPSPQEDP